MKALLLYAIQFIQQQISNTIYVLKIIRKSNMKVNGNFNVQFHGILIKLTFSENLNIFCAALCYSKAHSCITERKVLRRSWTKSIIILHKIHSE